MPHVRGDRRCCPAQQSCCVRHFAPWGRCHTYIHPEAFCPLWRVCLCAELPVHKGLHASGRAACYACMRPQVACVCEAPEVHNRTGIFVVQHPREARHPIGTVRLLRAALTRLSVQVWSPREEVQPFVGRLPPGSALLYPSPRAQELASLPLEERPRHLVVIDGTWAQAQSIYKASSLLQALPEVRLTPRAPSNYRIRREPHAYGLSTVEAVAEALHILEPQTLHLDSLPRALRGMVDTHLALRQARPQVPYRRQSRRPRSAAVPSLLCEHPDRQVVAYAEVIRSGGATLPVLLAALRPATGELFRTTLRPSQALTSGTLRRIGLEEADLVSAPSCQEAASRWRAFVGNDDVLLAWHPSTLAALSSLGKPHAALLLKATYCNWQRGAPGHLEAVVRRHDLQVRAAWAGHYAQRAALRLGSAVAIADFLRCRAAWDGLSEKSCCGNA